MKKMSMRMVSFLLVLCVMATLLSACGKKEEDTGPVHIDYVAETKLDMNSSTQKFEVQWGERSHIDGDTSHFTVPKTFDASGIVKARYLAVDTPESTGQIEEWGKAASRFTQEKLSTAAAILIESDGDTWTRDGNGRYLSWVWYKPTADADYRCLNIELLQNGLGASSSASEGRYGEIAVAAIAQASREKLYMFSGEKDPEYPYDAATSVTLKELRTNLDKYEGTKVSVEGIITCNSNYEAYIESFDAETEMYYGMQIFYGYDSQLIPVLAQGNMVRVVGVVNKFYDTYQISGLQYNRMEPDNPANTAQLSKNNPLEYPEVTAEQFLGQKQIVVNEETKSVPYASLAVATSLSMKNLTVVSAYTTTKETSDDKGAMTLTCKVDGYTITVRTAVLKDADGNLVTQDLYVGKTLDVRGLVEYYEGSYQIKVMTVNDITVH